MNFFVIPSFLYNPFDSALNPSYGKLIAQTSPVYFTLNEALRSLHASSIGL